MKWGPQAEAMLVDMRMSGVAPTLATHNAFINLCGARANSLAELPKWRHDELRRLNVRIDLDSAVGLANTQLQSALPRVLTPDLWATS